MRGDQALLQPPHAQLSLRPPQGLARRACCPPPPALSRSPTPHLLPHPARPLTLSHSRRQWHYFFLTDTGIAYLKEYLHLPEDVVPATLKKGAGGDAQEGVRGSFGGPDRGERRPFGDRAGGAPRPGGGADGYRRPAGAQ